MSLQSPCNLAIAVARPLLLAGLAEALGAFDSHFVTVNLADSAEQTKELEFSPDISHEMKELGARDDLTRV
jgi:hypothetical protein